MRSLGAAFGGPGVGAAARATLEGFALTRVERPLETPGVLPKLQSALGLALGGAWVQAGRGPRDVHGQAFELQRLCQLLCRAHGFDVRTSGPEPPPAAVLVSNHLGYIDPVVLCALHPCSPIAKVEVSRWALIGGLTRRLNVVFVHREDVVSRARTLLRSYRNSLAGVNILNFPEGTTTRRGLLPFQRGAFWVAKRVGRPVVPVAIQFDDPSLCWVDQEALLPHYVRLLTQRNRVLRVRFLPSLDPNGYPSAAALGAAARARIRAALAAGLNESV